MTLSEYLKKMQRVYPQYSKTEEYVIDILCSLVDENNTNIMEKINNIDTTRLRKFANPNLKNKNGGKLNRTLALEIYQYFKPYKFIEYLNGLSSELKNDIINQFKNEIVVINKINFADELSEKIRNIIYDISIEKYDTTNRNKKKLLPAEMIKMSKFQQIQIRKLIKKIENSGVEKMTKLKIEAKAISKKFGIKDEKIKRKISPYIMTYYKFVEKLFSNTEKADGIDTNKVRQTFRYKYEELAYKNNSKLEIYNELVDWMVKAFNVDEISSEIVISYFIQSCEVFDVIGKQNKQHR